MNIISRRITAAAALIAAPALIALGAATSAHAQTSLTDKGSTVSGPAKAGQQASPSSKAPRWQPRTHHQRRHHIARPDVNRG